MNAMCLIVALLALVAAGLILVVIGLLRFSAAEEALLDLVERALKPVADVLTQSRGARRGQGGAPAAGMACECEYTGEDCLVCPTCGCDCRGTCVGG